MIWVSDMTTWGYFIVIAALGLLACLMLYARLRARSSEKSIHHKPADDLVADELPVVEKVVEQTEVLTIPAVPRAASDAGEDLPDLELSPIVSERKDREHQKESDYIDELQEAAAGLAMLMRSSPVSRAQPVVFAPDDVEAEEEEEPKPVAEESPETQPEEIAVSGDSGVLPEEIDEAEIAEVAAPVTSIRDLLGDEVGDRIESIDAGLDALESLVVSIEDGLASLDALGLEDAEAGEIDIEAEAA